MKDISLMNLDDKPNLAYTIVMKKKITKRYSIIVYYKYAN